VLIQHTTAHWHVTQIVLQVFSKLFRRTINFTVFLPQDFATSAVFDLCLPQEISC
jgi:hypothetical protein